MKRVLWILLRVAIIVWFAITGEKMIRDIPVYRTDVSILFFLPIAFAFSAWRFSSILRRRYERRKAADDWSASLWTSPILRNPESFLVVGGIAFTATALLAFVIKSDRHGLDMQSMALTFGIGILAGWAIFRLRIKNRANQTPEPTPMAVTPPAAQEPRQP